MPTSLTSRQRVHRALERRSHDRVPRSDAYWPETLQRWQDEGLVGGEPEVRRRLRNDFDRVSWIWPTPWPGRHEVIEQDETTEVAIDRMGNTMRRWRDKSGTPEHIEFGCKTPDDWKNTYRPALLSAAFDLDLDAVRTDSARAEKDAAFVVLPGIEAFEGMRQLVGDETLLMAMGEEPDWVRDMARVYTDLIHAYAQAVFDTGVPIDAFWVYGDIGYNHGPFFSPAMYRDLIWPEHVRNREWATERGLKFIYHTDGDVRSLLPSLLEGKIDALQPMEAKAGMDIRELAPLYGKDLTFFGNIDMTVAIRGDRDEVEHEVRSKLEAGMANKGYIYHSDHSVPPQVSWETYQWIIEWVDRYGNYE